MTIKSESMKGILTKGKEVNSTSSTKVNVLKVTCFEMTLQAAWAMKLNSMLLTAEVIIFMINGNLYYENIFTIDLTSRFL